MKTHEARVGLNGGGELAVSSPSMTMQAWADSFMQDDWQMPATLRTVRFVATDFESTIILGADATGLFPGFLGGFTERPPALGGNVFADGSMEVPAPDDPVTPVAIRVASLAASITYLQAEIDQIEAEHAVAIPNFVLLFENQLI